MENFHSWELSAPLVAALDEAGYQKPTPVQTAVIPFLLAGQSDLIALAQTGTGKTAAFGIPLLERLVPGAKNPTALILCPTRELCMQISREFEKFSAHMDRVKITAVYGGTGYEKQEMELRRGTDIIVATPGRLIDHLQKGKINTSDIRTIVLDEADEMLNMGFREDLENILEYMPADREVWLFSATMPDDIRRLSGKFMKNPHEVKIGRSNQSADLVKHHVWWCRQDEKPALLERLIDSEPDMYGIVFTRTRKDAQELSEHLLKDGYTADALHGELSQAQRDRVMTRFRKKTIQILVATDVAARGIDVTDLTHVVHYSLPDDPEVYIHRSGRTARAGKEGISLILASRSRSDLVRKAEKMTGKIFETMEPPSQQDVLKLRMKNFFTGLKAAPLDEKAWANYYPDIFEMVKDLEPEELLMRFMQLHFGKWVNPEERRPAPARREGSRDEYSSRRGEGRGDRGDYRDRDSRGGRGDRDRSSSRGRDDRGGRSSSFGRERDYVRSERTSSSFGSDRPRSTSRDETISIGLNLGIQDGLGKRQIAKLVALATGVSEKNVTDVRMHGSRTEFKLPGSARNSVNSLESMEYPDKKLEVKII